MKKEHGGKVYVQVPEKERDSCEGCVADHDQPLCSALHVQGKRCDGKIWEEEMSERKTALELVDGLRDKMKSFNGTVLFDCVEGIKAAIEREQKAARGKYDKLFEQSIATAKAMRESAIVMRPISELPDKVPDGCVMAVFHEEGLMDWFEPEAYSLKKYIEDNHQFDEAMGFYILPLPVKERKLHPCPWCGAIPDKHQNYWVVKHNDTCAFEGTTIIRPVKEDTWGWE